jgi:hypothetical protein
MESKPKPMTPEQQSAIHVWMRMVAKIFNDNGIDKSVVIDKLRTRGLDTEWTDGSFKEDVYKPVFEKTSGGKISTLQADTKDHDIVIRGITKWVGQEFGVVLPPFPDRFNQGEDR